MKDAKTGGAHIWHQDYGYVCIAGSTSQRALKLCSLDELVSLSSGFPSRLGLGDDGLEGLCRVLLIFIQYNSMNIV